MKLENTKHPPPTQAGEALNPQPPNSEVGNNQAKTTNDRPSANGVGGEVKKRSGVKVEDDRKKDGVKAKDNKKEDDVKAKDDESKDENDDDNEVDSGEESNDTSTKDSDKVSNENDGKNEASGNDGKDTNPEDDSVSEDFNVESSDHSSVEEKVRGAYISLALGDRSTQDKRRTKLMRRLNDEMEYLVERTARVIEHVSRDPAPPKVLKKKRKKLAPQGSSTKSSEPAKGNEPSTITSSDSAVTILRDHLKQCHLEPQYRHVNIKGSGHMVEHTFLCILLDMTTEGKSRRKMEAKEEAALVMLKQMVRAQKTKTLNEQIPPFSDNDLKCMSSLLNEKDNFENHLQNMCYQIHEPPPLYSVAVQGTENKYYSVQCDAMGYTAIGNSRKEKIARKIAAKSILDLVAIDQEKEKEREKQMKAPLELVLPRREYHNFRI
ncbi:hypothetical protein M8J77_010849 [Diaphorina citri]|nr:hypothetical protein M8J77_010849 [Diaphorina citri]